MKPKAYIFDIDGTIADCSHRLHFITGEHKDWGAFYDACFDDAPINDVIKILNIIEWRAPAKVIFLTGRPEQSRLNTSNWIANYIGIETGKENLFMRHDGDHRPDYIVKHEIYEQEIKDKHNVIGVFEDRDSCVKMWRELGLTCFQVADGRY